MSLVSQTCAVHGRPTEYLTAGDGDPLVFLHGGAITEGFEPLEALTERFEVIVPLLPGFGKTPLDPAIESRDEVVAHTAGLFEALDIEKTALVGHSFGGWLAAATAASLPQRISKLVVVAPYGLDVAGSPLAEVFAMSPEEIRVALTNDQSVWEGIIPTGPDPAFEAARALEDQAVGRIMPGPFDPELESTLAAISQPTLILWGDDDKIVPAGHAPAWKAAITRAELRVYPGAGHLLLHERPEATDAIAEFAAG